jgi:hypothetical protein
MKTRWTIKIFVKKIQNSACDILFKHKTSTSLSFECNSCLLCYSFMFKLLNIREKKKKKKKQRTKTSVHIIFTLNIITRSTKTPCG